MSNRGLLGFEIDHLTFNIGYSSEPTAEEAQELNVFQLAHYLNHAGLNDTNTNQILDLYWEAFGEDIHVYKEKSSQKHNTYAIHWGKYRIMRLEDVDINSTLKQNINYKYKYRITLYGTLFALSRIQKIDHMEFITPFMADMCNDYVSQSVSRLDICADIYGVSTQSIRRGIQGDKAHFKDISKINENALTKSAETIYYGKRGQDWMARIYNKLLDIKAKGKELLFPDYLNAGHEKVTRLEIELKSAAIKKSGIDMFNVFDRNRLFSIYKQTLKNKYVEFKIVDFIEKELAKQGYKAFKIKPQKLNYNALSEVQVCKRFANNARKLIEDFETEPEQLYEIINNLMRDNPNQKN